MKFGTYLTESAVSDINLSKLSVEDLKSLVGTGAGSRITKAKYESFSRADNEWTYTVDGDGLKMKVSVGSNGKVTGAFAGIK